MSDSQKTTHFGFQSIPWNEKEKKVGEVFHAVAEKYDLMNDIMSLGIHRLWKKFAVELSHVKPGHTILDVAGGSGDLTQLFSKKVGKSGLVVLSDINQSMLEKGRDKLLDEGLHENIQFIQANGEQLPFASNTFDCI